MNLPATWQNGICDLSFASAARPRVLAATGDKIGLAEFLPYSGLAVSKNVPPWEFIYDSLMAFQYNQAAPSLLPDMN